MNGIRNASFVVGLLAFFGATLYEYGAKTTTEPMLLERWQAYQAFCLKVAVVALIVVLASSLILWISGRNRRERQRQDASLVAKTERRVKDEIASSMDKERQEKEKLFAQMGCDRNGYPHRA